MRVQENATDRMVPTAFRVKESTRFLLRSIQKRKGHADLSDTLREAVDEYIRREQELAA